ncbi:MAG: 3-deoxy-8-phosphooctulonate synthase [Elusimicrobia bacterium]|nr:3-deoxy-8-phosphooctulonate synthase [Elusimicrobiota bacterium]
MSFHKLEHLSGEKNSPLFIAGPCVMESRELVYEAADFLAGLKAHGLKIIMKFSYDKANRTSKDSYRGPGIEEGMKIIADVRKRSKLPILVDVHTPQEASLMADAADIIQIPAFLCRQTSLIEAAGATGCFVNIKKGQFMSPYAMKQQADKALSAGAAGVFLTERGTFFGYGDLVVDMRSMVIMKKSGFPVIFDATHSQQKPASSGSETGGAREFIEPLSLAALSVGADGFFFEIHPRPNEALSDRETQMDFESFEALALKLQKKGSRQD